MNARTKDPVEEVMNAFDKFKNAHDARLNEIQNQLDQIQTIAQRPSTGSINGQKPGAVNAEMKMLAQFARTGDDAAFFNAARSNGLMIGDDTAGGYLVSPEVSTQIIIAIRAVSPLRQLARIEIVGMNAGGSFEEPKEIGEMGAAWVGETESRDDTGDPEFGLTRINLDEVEAMVPVTQRLLDDSQFDLGTWIVNATARRFARTEGEAYAIGDGVKKPRGFTTYETDIAADSLRSYDKWQHVMSGSDSAITADGLRDLFWSLGAGYRVNSTWLMSSATAASIDKLKDAYGDYLWRNAESEGAPPTLLGRPVEIDENLPAVATGTLPVWLGDWSRAYLIIERPGIRFQRDPFSRRPYILFYSYRRTGGGASDFCAAKALKIGT